MSPGTSNGFEICGYIMRWDDILPTNGWRGFSADYVTWAPNVALMFPPPTAGLALNNGHDAGHVGQWLRLYRDEIGVWGEGVVVSPLGRWLIDSGVRGLSIGMTCSTEGKVDKLGISHCPSAIVREASLTDSPRNPKCLITGIRPLGSDKWIGTPARGVKVPCIWMDWQFQTSLIARGGETQVGKVFTCEEAVLSPDTPKSRLEFLHMVKEQAT